MFELIVVMTCTQAGGMLVYACAQISMQLAKMSIDLKFVELTADVLIIFFIQKSDLLCGILV